MLSLQSIQCENKEPRIWIKKTNKQPNNKRKQKNTQQLTMATNLYTVAPSQIELQRP